MSKVKVGTHTGTEPLMRNKVTHTRLQGFKMCNYFRNHVKHVTLSRSTVISLFCCLQVMATMQVAAAAYIFIHYSTKIERKKKEDGGKPGYIQGGWNTVV